MEMQFQQKLNKLRELVWIFVMRTQIFSDKYAHFSNEQRQMLVQLNYLKSGKSI